MVSIASKSFTVVSHALLSEATIQVTAHGGEVVEFVDFVGDGDVDFEPVRVWASKCSLSFCPPPPFGWRIQAVEVGHA